MKKTTSVRSASTEKAVREYRSSNPVGVIYYNFFKAVREDFRGSREKELKALHDYDTDYLFKRYSRVILKYAHHYNGAFGKRFDVRDLLSAGFIGLNDAIQRYLSPRCAFTVDAVVRHSGKHEKAVFLPYAESGIKNAILQEIAQEIGFTGISRSGDWSKVQFVSYEEAVANGEIEEGYAPEKISGYIANEFLKICKEILTDEEFLIIKAKVNGLTFDEIAKGQIPVGKFHVEGSFKNISVVSRQAVSKRFSKICEKIFDRLLPENWREFSKKELKAQFYQAVILL